MNPEDDASNWQDADGESPDLTANWTWDLTSLEVGEYVGFKLYKQLRARVATCQVPDSHVNRVILHMIHMHDQELVDHGVGCATLVTHDQTDEQLRVVRIVEPEHVAPIVDVVNWKTLLEDKLNLATGDLDHLLDEETDQELPDPEADDTIE